MDPVLEVKAVRVLKQITEDILEGEISVGPPMAIAIDRICQAAASQADPFVAGLILGPRIKRRLHEKN